MNRLDGGAPGPHGGGPLGPVPAGARPCLLPCGYRLDGSDATEAAAGDRSQLEREDPESPLLETVLALQSAGNGTEHIARALNMKGTISMRRCVLRNRGSPAATLAARDRWTIAMASTYAGWKRHGAEASSAHRAAIVSILLEDPVGLVGAAGL